MKLLWCLPLLLAGCASSLDPTDPVLEETDCNPTLSGPLYFGAGHTLLHNAQDAGRTPGNGFAEAFLTNELEEWTYVAQDFSYLVTGNVTVTFWTQGNNMPAPIVIGGEPGEGYHFFNQFGTDRGFVESYAIEYASVLADSSVTRYEEVYEMPVGGLTVEAGDTLRLLLTNLVMDSPDGAGPDILWGGDTPSNIQLEVQCIETPTWAVSQEESTPFDIPFHHGLLTGAVPDQEGINHAIVPFTLAAATERLTIIMEQTGGPNPIKDDMDMAVLDAQGKQVWSIGSPYTDEIGTRWQAQLDAHMPPGNYDIRIDSYSGHGYEGRITVTQEVAA